MFHLARLFSRALVGTTGAKPRGSPGGGGTLRSCLQLAEGSVFGFANKTGVDEGATREAAAASHQVHSAPPAATRARVEEATNDFRAANGARESSSRSG